MKDLGYGKNRQYGPDTEAGLSDASYFPEDMPRQIFYELTTCGHARKILERFAAGRSCKAVIQPMPSPSPTKSNPSTKGPEHD